MQELIKIRSNILSYYNNLLGSEVELPLTFIGKISNKVVAVIIKKVNFQSGIITVEYCGKLTEISCFELAEMMVELYNQD